MKKIIKKLKKSAVTMLVLSFMLMATSVTASADGLEDLGKTVDGSALTTNESSEAVEKTLTRGNIKSSVGLGIILYQGIGDTIRVSLTGDPVEEVKSAKMILRTLGLRKGGIEVVSCPTCGRTKIDLIGLANQVETMVEEFPLDIKVAVMGCAVNGPGEAKEADIGIAGGQGEGLLIKHGEIIKKVPEDQLLETLRYELQNWKK